MCCGWTSITSCSTATEGVTLPINLTVLCGRCHKNVHQGRLRISGTRERLVSPTPAVWKLQDLAAPLGWMDCLRSEPDMPISWYAWRD